jgi:hypothetical protein
VLEFLSFLKPGAFIGPENKKKCSNKPSRIVCETVRRANGKSSQRPKLEKLEQKIK